MLRLTYLRITVTALCALACYQVKPAYAQTLLYDFVATPAYRLNWGNSGNDGFRFTLNTSKRLTGLGFWDLRSNGLVHPHPIGLWNSAGTLLATATVTNSTSSAVASADNTGRWLFESISSVVLGAGTYTLAAFSPANSDYLSYYQDISTMSNASIDVLAYGNATSSLTLPSDPMGWFDGAYGPNAQLASVPEASSFALLLAGAAPLGLIARKRLRRKG